MKKGEGWYENFFTLKGFKELNMFNCGKRVKNFNHQYGPAIRKFFLLIMIKEGCATLHSHKDKIRLNPGDLLVMFPDSEVHYIVDKDVPWTISWVGVYGSFVENFMEKIGISASKPVHHVKNRYEIEDILEKIYNQSHSQEYSDKICIIGLLYKFFSVLLSEKKYNYVKDYTAEVKELIERNFDKDISVEEIAYRFNINKNYLTRIFKQKYNMTIKDYLINTRINRAKELLADESASVLKVSNSVGYADPLYFSRIFKKKTKLSPLQYRKTIAKN